MATFNEIGQNYAEQVRGAEAADQKLEWVKKKYAPERISAWSPAVTNLMAALKKITRDLEALRIKEEPLTDEEKDEILRQAGAALGMENPEDFAYLTKGASNDAATYM